MEKHPPRNSKEVLTACLTLAELHETFTLDELISFTKDSMMEEWLSSRFLDAQAKRIKEADIKHMNIDELILFLCDTLSLDMLHFDSREISMVLGAIERENKRLERKAKCADDGIIVASQGELIGALADENVNKVYLCSEIFSIPLTRQNMTYDGRDNAVINITAQNDEPLDFDANKIYFFNLTLIFHYLEPHQVKLDYSKNNNVRVIFLYANRLSQRGNLTEAELAALMKKRSPFETSEYFKNRAAHLDGAILGTIYLNDRDYDYWRGIFYIKPIWRYQFIKQIHDYINGGKLGFYIDVREAENLYLNERVGFVYGDFDTFGDEIILKRMYLRTNGGKIYDVYPIDFGVDSGGAGYGLHLIADFSI